MIDFLLQPALIKAHRQRWHTLSLSYAMRLTEMLIRPSTTTSTAQRASSGTSTPVRIMSVKLTKSRTVTSVSPLTSPRMNGQPLEAGGENSVRGGAEQTGGPDGLAALLGGVHSRSAFPSKLLCKRNFGKFGNKESCSKGNEYQVDASMHM